MGRNLTFLGHPALFMPWSIMALKPHVQMTFRALKQSRRTFLSCSLVLCSGVCIICMNLLPRVVHYSRQFYSPSSPHAALFLESYLLLLIYIIFCSRANWTLFEENVLHSSVAFAGVSMSSLSKLQMPSNMHGTSENTKKNRVWNFLVCYLAFLSKTNSNFLKGSERHSS